MDGLSEEGRGLRGEAAAQGEEGGNIHRLSPTLTDRQPRYLPTLTLPEALPDALPELLPLPEPASCPPSALSE